MKISRYLYLFIVLLSGIGVCWAQQSRLREDGCDPRGRLLT